MLAWSEGTDNGRQKTNHGYDVIVGGELFTDYSDHPRKLVTLNQNSNQQAPDATSFFPVGGMPTASSLAWKTSLRKVRTLWRLQQIERGALPMIDRGDIRQAIAIAAISGLPCRALVMVSSSIRLTAWLQNSKKRAERSEIDVWAEPPRLSPLWLSASSSACHGLLIITIDNAITYKAFDKYLEELKLANAAITDMQMRQRDVAALDAKYTKELADAKAENDALHDDVAAGRRRLHQSSLSVSALNRTASGVDNQPPDWQTPLNGIISPSERGWSLCKNNWKEPRSILMSDAMDAHIDGQLMQLLWAIHALPAEYKCLKVIKPSNPFTNVCWVSVLTTFSAPPQILAASTTFFCPIQKRRNDGWWFLWCYCCRFVLNSKRLLSIL